jgi:hypothetical protein
MHSGADVRSIPALQDFHASLVTFRTDASEAMVAVELAVRRVVDFIAEQGSHWQETIRELRDAIVQAKAELSRKKTPGFDGRMPDCTVEEKRLRALLAKMDHAEEMLNKARMWSQRFPRIVGEVYEGPARRFGAFLEGDLPRGLAMLERRLAALAAYMETMAPSMPRPVLGADSGAAPGEPAPGADSGADTGSAS